MRAAAQCLGATTPPYYCVRLDEFCATFARTQSVRAARPHADAAARCATARHIRIRRARRCGESFAARCILAASTNESDTDDVGPQGRTTDEGRAAHPAHRHRHRGRKPMSRPGNGHREVVACATLLLLAALGWAAGPAFAQQPAPPAQQALQEYRLNPGDQLEISIWKEPDLTKTVQVRPDGKFSVPLAGEIVAAGRTVAQVQSDITNRLLKYIPEPVVTASLTVLEGNRVYVIGQVTKPGAYVMNPRLSVLQALAVAGGMTPFAAANDILVMRGNGRAQRMLPFRYGEVVRGRNLEQNVTLEAGDVVVVP
jgi:polysaccharide export outer membrane protein